MLAVALVALIHDSAAAGDARRVGVLPLVAGDKELRIYSKPIADAVVRGLKAELGVTVDTLAGASAVPPGIDLVIDGEISKTRRGISLMGRVRDPALGRTVGSVVVGPGRLEKLDRLADELAVKLAAVAAGWKKRSRAREPYRLKEIVVETPVPIANRGPAPPASAPSPALVVLRAAGSAAGGTVAVADQATDAAMAFADRLGLRYVATAIEAPDTGASPGPAAEQVRRSGARFALSLRMLAVEYSYRGVLSARGVARVQLIDGTGAISFDRVVRTDTVVGSRGDRHSALIYAVAEQCLDIAAPTMRRVLRR